MLKSDLVAGVGAGVVGLIVFLIIHHFRIRPIWFILPIGLVIAALGGAVVGWSYAEIRSGLPEALALRWLAVTGIVLLMLAPGVILAEFRPSFLDLESMTLNVGLPAGKLALHFVWELVIPAILIGAGMGWWLGHSWQASLATGLAGLIYAVGPGHNIPFLSGYWPATAKGLLLLVAITISAAGALVFLQAELGSR